ncbi:hypothetical protein D3C72_1729120 [compost metagenome]
MLPIRATPTRAPICRFAFRAAAALFAYCLPATRITVAVMAGMTMPMATFMTAVPSASSANGVPGRKLISNSAIIAPTSKPANMGKRVPWRAAILPARKLPTV